MPWHGSWISIPLVICNPVSRNCQARSSDALFNMALLNFCSALLGPTHIEGSCPGKDGQACVWEAATGKLLRTYINNSGMNWGCVTHDNHLLACSGNRGLKCWDVQSSSTNQLLPGRPPARACMHAHMDKLSKHDTTSCHVHQFHCWYSYLVVWLEWLIEFVACSQTACLYLVNVSTTPECSDWPR